MTRVKTFPTRDDVPDERLQDYDAVFAGLGRIRRHAQQS